MHVFPVIQQELENMKTMSEWDCVCFCKHCYCEFLLSNKLHYGLEYIKPNKTDVFTKA